LRAGDVVFEVEDVRTGGVTFLRGGEELRGYLAGSAGYRVVAVDITYHTSKTVGKKSVLKACDAGEVELIGDLVEWVLRSGVMAADRLTDRYFKGRRKSLLPKEVRETVKSFCKGIGLDRTRFFTKSMRSGYATHYSACEGSASGRNARGG
jgi:hypothetical protein